MSDSKPIPRALVWLATGFEEIETVTPINLLRRADVDVTIVSIEATTEVTGRTGITLCADCLAADLTHRHWNAVIIPGGPGHTRLMNHPQVRQSLLEQDRRKGWIAAICAGPLVLNDLGLLSGHRHTAHFTTKEELRHRDDAATVVRDGHVITSQGAGTATAFALALVEALRGTEVSTQVANSICWRDFAS